MAKEIVINGLPFVEAPGGRLSLFDTADLDLYYADCVIGGPGSFSLPIYSVDEFAEAIRTKLVLEIAGLVSPVIRASDRLPLTACDVGERQWNRFIGNERPRP